MPLRQHATFANVTSATALLVALAGSGVAVAAGVAPNSVGSAQIKNGAVARADLKANAVDSSKVASNTITGSDVKESTLGTVPTAAVATNVLSATVSDTGTLVRGRYATTAERNSMGRYYVTFDRDISECALTATITDGPSGSPPNGEIGAAVIGGSPTKAYVPVRNSAGTLFTDADIHVVVVC